jgi:hypothetical protein
MSYVYAEVLLCACRGDMAKVVLSKFACNAAIANFKDRAERPVLLLGLYTCPSSASEVVAIAVTMT